MPMPKPNKSESWDDFKDRCMADDTMVSEYDDPSQREAVCRTQFRQHEKENKARSEGHELVAEVFAVGKWNGMAFSAEDLDDIANAFKALGNQHRVPLKFGHNDEQPMTDGQPAIGWVDDVWVENDKLLARFVAVPDVVYQAIKAGRYRNVSVELDLNVEHRGQHYDAVLSGVALLGADLPAVNVLEDLTAYMTRPQRGYAASRTAMFTAIKGEPDMASEEKIDRAEFERAEKARKEAEARAEQAEKDAKAAKDEVEKFKADQAKAEFKRQREDFKGRLDQLVKDEVILPARRDALLAKVEDDDEAKFAVVRETIEALEEGNAKANTPPPGEKGKHMKREDQEDKDQPASMRFAREVRKVMREKGIKEYRRAADLVSDEQPELAQEWANENLKEVS